MAGESAARAGVRITVPKCEEKGLGNVIGAIDSVDLIAGVRLAPLKVHPDDRGYFLELT